MDSRIDLTHSQTTRTSSVSLIPVRGGKNSSRSKTTYQTKATNAATMEVCPSRFHIENCFLLPVYFLVSFAHSLTARLILLPGLLMTIINLAYVFANPAPKCAPDQQKKNTDNLNSRANLLMAGLWWAAFSIFVLCGLKSRPGPPLPNLKAYIVTPWKRLWYTFR